MRYNWSNIHWRNSVFLIATFVTSITAVPAYIIHYGLSTFQFVMFMFFFISTGMSITLGYHRLFSHLTFHAAWPVKVYTLFFGAAAFEGSALGWSADHRRHHKFVDHDEDPYDISKGFFHAHIGWLLFRMENETPLTWVRDLQRDKLAVLQHEYYVPLAFFAGFIFPTLIGLAVGGWVTALGCFLIAGVARIVFVHHTTFCINSMCHWIGDRPYSTKCSARNSMIMALVTFGEGYHNFHHEFQHDYRNGVKPWQFDPTKWVIWTLNKCGLARNLRTVPEEKILKAQIMERQRQVSETLAASTQPVPERFQTMLHNAQEAMHEALAHWEAALVEYREARQRRQEDKAKNRRTMKRDLQDASQKLQEALKHWSEVQRKVFGSSLPA